MTPLPLTSLASPFYVNRRWGASFESEAADSSFRLLLEQPCRCPNARKSESQSSGHLPPTAGSPHRVLPPRAGWRGESSHSAVAQLPQSACGKSPALVSPHPACLQLRTSSPSQGQRPHPHPLLRRRLHAETGAYCNGAPALAVASKSPRAHPACLVPCCPLTTRPAGISVATRPPLSPGLAQLS